MPNITVSADVNTLLTSTTLNASTSALGTLGAPVTSAAIVAKIAGAVQNVARIGKEFMPESFDVISLKLGNAGAVSLPAGTLSLNTAGAMVLHDGLRNGNNISNISNSNNCQQFFKELPTASLQNTTYILPLARFMLPASVAVSGKTLCFTGDVYVQNLFSIQPDGGIYLFWRRYGDNDLTKIIYYTPPVTTTPFKLSVTLSVLMNANSTIANGASKPAVIRTSIGATEGAACLSVADGLNGGNLAIATGAFDIITIGQPIDIEFGITTVDSSGLVTGSYAINGFMGISNS